MSGHHCSIPFINTMSIKGNVLPGLPWEPWEHPPRVTYLLLTCIQVTKIAEFAAIHCPPNLAASLTYKQTQQTEKQNPNAHLAQGDFRVPHLQWECFVEGVGEAQHYFKGSPDDSFWGNVHMHLVRSRNTREKKENSAWQWCMFILECNSCWQLFFPRKAVCVRRC